MLYDTTCSIKKQQPANSITPAMKKQGIIITTAVSMEQGICVANEDSVDDSSYESDEENSDEKTKDWIAVLIL